MAEEKLNYDLLLDDWAEEVLRRADEAVEKMEKEERGTYPYGFSKGYSEAVYQAVAQLRLLEQRKKHKYIIPTETTSEKD